MERYEPYQPSRDVYALLGQGHIERVAEMFGDDAARWMTVAGIAIDLGDAQTLERILSYVRLPDWFMASELYAAASRNQYDIVDQLLNHVNWSMLSQRLNPTQLDNLQRHINRIR